MTFAAGNRLRAADLINAFQTWFVSSGAAGTGVSTTETKDASGDLTFVAVEGYTYEVAYSARALGVSAAHYIDVRVRDGGSSSPTNASTELAGTTVPCATSTSLGSGFTLVKPLDCPDDIPAGTHKIAVFYVRNSSGATTNNVQLENAGPHRRLSVSSRLTAST
jgi:hypothetical protein